MPHATFPSVYWDETQGQWVAQMRDKKTNRVWSSAKNTNRILAIRDARRKRPRDPQIKRVIGWADRHPFWGGFAAGIVASCFASDTRTGRTVGLGTMFAFGLIAGTVTWIAHKLFIGQNFQLEGGEDDEMANA